ncbi:MAG: hypothetical protein IPN76_28320 [Saprospiraceae bacterium]|nr:hypothetical protein [Saprospiraceae bacterium]
MDQTKLRANLVSLDEGLGIKVVQETKKKKTVLFDNDFLKLIRQKDSLNFINCQPFGAINKSECSLHVKNK